MRSKEEILDRIKKENQKDLLGMSIGDLVSVLSFEEAESIRNEDVTKEIWGEVSSKDPESVKDRLLSYLPFAIDKCLSHRGISASRSIGHMRNFVWLMEDDEALAFVEDDNNYPNYGAPVLRYLCQRYGFDYSKDLSDEEMKAFERMSIGLSCIDGCREGCGK